MYRLVWEGKSIDGKNGNEPPQGFREIDEEKFCELDCINCACCFVEFRQIPYSKIPDIRRGISACLSIKLFWFEDTKGGWGIATDNCQVRYFLFGCSHEKITKLESSPEKSIRGSNIYKCDECKQVFHIDSSD